MKKAEPKEEEEYNLKYFENILKLKLKAQYLKREKCHYTNEGKICFEKIELLLQGSFP